MKRLRKAKEKESTAKCHAKGRSSSSSRKGRTVERKAKSTASSSRPADYESDYDELAEALNFTKVKVKKKKKKKTRRPKAFYRVGERVMVQYENEIKPGEWSWWKVTTGAINQPVGKSVATYDVRYATTHYQYDVHPCDMMTRSAFTNGRRICGEYALGVYEDDSSADSDSGSESDSDSGIPKQLNSRAVHYTNPFTYSDDDLTNDTQPLGIPEEDLARRAIEASLTEAPPPTEAAPPVTPPRATSSRLTLTKQQKQRIEENKAKAALLRSKPALGNSKGPSGKVEGPTVNFSIPKKGSIVLLNFPGGDVYKSKVTNGKIENDVNGNSCIRVESIKVERGKPDWHEFVLVTEWEERYRAPDDQNMAKVDEEGKLRRTSGDSIGPTIQRTVQTSSADHLASLLNRGSKKKFAPAPSGGGGRGVNRGKAKATRTTSTRTSAQNTTSTQRTTSAQRTTGAQRTSSVQRAKYHRRARSSRWCYRV